MNFSLNQMGSELLEFIKNSPSTLSEVSTKALGIQYHNFQRRASKNRVRFDELAAISDFLGLEVTITIGEMTFTGVPTDSPMPQQEIVLQKKLIEMQERVILLQDELAKCQKAVPA